MNQAPSPALLRPQSTADATWWKGAVIYEVYVRSFLDTNGDGIGDLPGITRGLDHIASLGVEAIWVSPFFASPMADFGYDISDYRAVDPLFGTLGDFDHLLREAHARGLRVMIDQVLSHTSCEHPWFRESRSSRDNPRSDWYVWADARPDGSPPNNWLSIFGGVAWTWDPRRCQYYLHNFLSSQPDLNFHNPQVRAAALENVRFWLERGVDGLRLDAINFCFHDAALRDNPAKPPAERVGRGFRSDNPYAYQYHLHNNTQPENLPFLEELRRLVDGYPGVVLLGEISAEDSNATMAEYTRPGRLHMGYSFELLGAEHSPGHIRSTAEQCLAGARDAWPCWSISNHDVERVVTRWGGAHASPRLATLYTALACSLRGSVCVYQGEELGLPEAQLAFEDLRDPYGISFWPMFKGRDGCRTPMPWTDGEHAGFSSARPWLPVPDEHRSLSIRRQQADPGSALSGFRQFLAWRAAHPLLRTGGMEFLGASGPLLVFLRTGEGESLLVAFNLSETPASWPIPDGLAPMPLAGHGLAEGRIQGRSVALPAHGAFFARVGTGSAAQRG